MSSVFLLTGSPGTGKTTIIRETLDVLSVKAGGFYTQEIREAGIRKGFTINTLDGRQSVLAHVDFTGLKRVGKYGVNTDNLESTGVTAINEAIDEADLIVIDEIGKMELFSPLFREAVLKAIASGKRVLGTIMLKPHPFADAIKKRPEVKLFEVTISNRRQVFNDLVKVLSQTS